MDGIAARRFAIKTKESDNTIASLSVGDRVVVTNIRPKYLEGVIATVVELPKRGKKVIVRLEETRRQWAAGTESKIPASCLQPHDGGPTDSDLNPPSQNGRFSIRVTTVGNPDFSQYAPITDPTTFNSNDWESLVEQLRQYQTDWLIGGGNWTDPVLFKDGKPIGNVSFNCRVWELGKQYPDAKEIPHSTISDDSVFN